MTVCWNSPDRTVRGDTSADWSGTSTSRTFILSVMMAWLAGWPEQSTPANVAVLLDAALKLFDDPGEPKSCISRRLQAALAEVVSTWKQTPKAGKASSVDACARLALAGVKAILKGQYHSPGRRAAVLAAAPAEVVQAQHSDAAAVKLLDDLAARHRRHSEFKGELAIRRRQMRSGPSA